jgi:hypothetical protein
VPVVPESPSPSPSLLPRPAREIIDAAIQENRSWEWLSYALTIAFAVVGLTVLVVGAIQGEGVIAASGAAASALFWPAMRNAVLIRRANIRIRMFELALSQAKNSKDAATLIRDAMGHEPAQEK